MKKMEYNKYTHEINIIKKKKYKRVRKLRKFLNKNQIFIILIPSLALTVMSVLISCFGYEANRRSVDIYEKQLEIMENDRDPYFIIKCDSIDNEVSNGDNDNKQKVYTITNKGGLITGAYLFDIYKLAIIKIREYSPEFENTYIIYFSDQFIKTEGIISLYNEHEKNFKFYSYEHDKFNKLIYDLQQKLKEIYPDKESEWSHKASVQTEDIVEINYINYKNEEYIQKYQFWDTDHMIIMKNDPYKNAIHLGAVDINEDPEEIIEYICEKIKVKRGEIESDPNKVWFNKSSSIELTTEDALREAKLFLEKYTYSYDSLIEQLEKVGHSHKNSVYAVNNCGADWNEQAIQTAKNHLSFGPRSYNKLKEELMSIEKFTYEQTVHGINNCDADWNEQAKRKAQEYIHINDTYSYTELINLLENDGFTHEQAVYGTEQNGYQK